MFNIYWRKYYVKNKEISFITSKSKNFVSIFFFFLSKLFLFHVRLQKIPSNFIVHDLLRLPHRTRHFYESKIMFITFRNMNLYMLNVYRKSNSDGTTQRRFAKEGIFALQKKKVFRIFLFQKRMEWEMRGEFVLHNERDLNNKKIRLGYLLHILYFQNNSNTNGVAKSLKYFSDWNFQISYICAFVMLIESKLLPLLISSRRNFIFQINSL